MSFWQVRPFLLTAKNLEKSLSALPSHLGCCQHSDMSSLPACACLAGSNVCVLLPAGNASLPVCTMLRDSQEGKQPVTFQDWLEGLQEQQQKLTHPSSHRGWGGVWALSQTVFWPLNSHLDNYPHNWKGHNYVFK